MPEIPYVEDALAYFRDALPKFSTYMVRVMSHEHEDNKDYRIEIADSDSSFYSKIKSSSESINSVIDYISTNQDALEKEYDLKISFWKQRVGSNTIVTARKLSRKSSNTLIRQGVNAEVYKFVEKAYQSGVNIMIAGQTASGKTSFLNTLMDSSKDYLPTVLTSSFDEMMFGTDHREIIKLISREESIVNHAMSMNTPRMVLDEMYPVTKHYAAMKKIAGKGKQFVMVVHTGTVAMADEKEELSDILIDYQKEHPFEIRVDVKLDRVNGEYFPSIVAVHELIAGKQKTVMQTLYSGDKFIKHPTRSIRRKMEGKTKPRKGISLDNGEVDFSSMPALVAVSNEEKKELLVHRDALSALLHESNAYEALNHFNAIDEFLKRIK